MTRKQWRELPLEFVLLPTLHAPMLVFDFFDPPLFTDRTGRVCLAQPMLDEARANFRLLKFAPTAMEEGARNELLKKRRMFTAFLRELWCQMVDQAQFYTWPGVAPAVYDFHPGDV